MCWSYALIFFSLLLSVLIQGNNIENFGPFTVDWLKFETCKGPKQTDCGKVQLENTKNMSDVIFVLDFPKDCPVTKAKITTGAQQYNNATKKLWNYALDNPCQHFVLGPILMESFNLTNNCKVHKGFYRVHVNMEEKNSMFLGSSFFYGSYRFKIFAYNKVSNFFCVDTLIDVVKKRLN